MRDPDKYYYVELALPKDNAAIARMVADAERLDTPLRIFIKQLCINAYSSEIGEPADVPAQKPVEVKHESVQERKAMGSGEQASVSSQSIESASAFLDQM